MLLLRLMSACGVYCQGDAARVTEVIRYFARGGFIGIVLACAPR